MRKPADILDPAHLTPDQPPLDLACRPVRTCVSVTCDLGSGVLSEFDELSTQGGSSSVRQDGLAWAWVRLAVASTTTPRHRRVASSLPCR